MLWAFIRASPLLRFRRAHHKCPPRNRNHFQLHTLAQLFRLVAGFFSDAFGDFSLGVDRDNLEFKEIAFLARFYRL
ncbi:hypothetical protein THIOM_003243 [Candidatus Thiomargarita nelsonii]|uniref:Uncharacterized protein n=1 Tax=Candidatus Thiomargarita nelsonii TaxID=1003181 RepID=A0A176RZ90_9GAMM|nr:hypothetical protein THIOM_003243 [Candidatus Thiomargarita nelsonii]